MSLDEKTETAQHLEVLPSPSPPAVPEYRREALIDGQLLTHDIRPAAERRLVRKLDIHLLPTIMLIYIINYIDVSRYTRCRGVT